MSPAPSFGTAAAAELSLRARFQFWQAMIRGLIGVRRGRESGPRLNEATKG